MLKNSMKETAACSDFLDRQVAELLPRDFAKLAWHAACLWQRTQDTKIVADYILHSLNFPISAIIALIEDQRRLSL